MIYAQKSRQVMPPRPDEAASSMPPPAAVLKFHRSRDRIHSHQLELEEFDPILRSKPTDFFESKSSSKWCSNAKNHL